MVQFRNLYCKAKENSNDDETSVLSVDLKHVKENKGLMFNCV